MKKVIRIILQVCILFLFNFLGNIIQQFFNLGIPGSIIGLLLLFICLTFKVIPVEVIEEGAGFLLGILMLFFIPATVGVMNYPTLLSAQGALFITAVLLSTIFAIVIVGIAGQYLEKKEDKKCNKHSSH